MLALCKQPQQAEFRPQTCAMSGLPLTVGPLPPSGQTTTHTSCTREPPRTAYVSQLVRVLALVGRPVVPVRVKAREGGGRLCQSGGDRMAPDHSLRRRMYRSSTRLRGSSIVGRSRL